MKKTLCTAALLLLLFSCGKLETYRTSYSSGLFITAGAAHWENSSGKTVYTLGYELWIFPCRAVGFYIDAGLRPDDRDNLVSVSCGVALRTIGFHDFKPCLMLGFMAARTESKENLYAMPVTLGAEYWFSSKIAVRAHARWQMFCKETMYSLQGGLGFRL